MDTRLSFSASNCVRQILYNFVQSRFVNNIFPALLQHLKEGYGRCLKNDHHAVLLTLQCKSALWTCKLEIKKIIVQRNISHLKGHQIILFCSSFRGDIKKRTRLNLINNNNNNNQHMITNFNFFSRENKINI